MKGRSGFLRQTFRAVLALVIALLLPAIACAYTLVLKSGRQIEIPDNFIITQTTLTYEVAPTINVTVQMASINITATERANHEAPGSLLRRVDVQERAREAQGHQTYSPTQVQKIVTNRELAPIRRAREESEARYEQRLRELGLPSLEETRQRDAEETRRALARTALVEEQQARDEAYWRTRSENLRERIAELDGQINYLYARLSETPNGFSTGSYTVVSTVAPIVPFRHSSFGRVGVFSTGFGRANQPSVIQNGTSIIGRTGFGGGSSRVQVLVNPTRASLRGARAIAGQPVFGRRVIGGAIGTPILPVFPTTVVTVPNTDQFYYERDAMLTELYELEAERAGLLSRWRVLEDEARRAGVPPGWLRP
ncbi:MAG: hypothetical protein AUG51_25410 [Acidobacteria bacterium 13_1_20CM_3_53_8]|nr:MAG: hypothetical protein AUG51_25410 [Acidobacteria bacterium 13_1_20CM_3_53_8]